MRRTAQSHTQHVRPSGRRAPRVRHTVGGLTVLLAAALAAAGLSPAAAPVAAPDGWTTVWEDTFDGAAGSLPSADNWIFNIGNSYPGGAPNWGTGEIAYHTDDPANVSLDGSGNLTITPRRDDAGNWTSARIETQRTDFEPAPGGALRIESRMRLPDVAGAEAQGIWPAFWALGAPFRGNYTNWPAVGEIDIMENVNGENSVFATLHCGVAPGGPCNEFTGLSNTRSGFAPTLQGDFHTFALEWDRSTSPEQLRWYVDGQQFHQVTEDQVDATTWANATDHGYFVILNVAVGGSWPGPPTAQTAPGRPLVVDHVGVYSR